MPATDFGADREYSDSQFSAQGAFRSDHLKAVCGYFEPGRFIPVHAPGSDGVVHVREGTGVVRESDTDQLIEPGDVATAFADVDGGVKADEDGWRLCSSPRRRRPMPNTIPFARACAGACSSPGLAVRTPTEPYSSQ